MRRGIKELIGGSKHHWLISQKMMKDKPWLSAIGNQFWNIVKFKTHSAHMKYAEHGNFISKFIYGTPTWFKSIIGSRGWKNVG